MRANGEDNKLYDFYIEMGMKFRPLVQTLGAAYTMDRDQATLNFLDPGGATRVVTLPAAEKGLAFWILNTADAAEDLTIKNAAATTLGTISQNESGWAVCDGTNWYCTLVGTTT